MYTIIAFEWGHIVGTIPEQQPQTQTVQLLQLQVLILVRTLK